MTMLKTVVLPVLIIIGIALFTLYPSFNLALFGDDWLAFFRYTEHIDGKLPVLQTHINYFLTPYGAQDILMGFLRKIYGYDSGAYYLISFVFRMLAAFSFYPLVRYLTKNRLSAFFAVLFFSVTAIGLDATNWVFNMPTYLTIAFFNIFLYFFLSSRISNNLKLLILSGIFYYLAYIFTPIRMHGSLPFIFLLELFWIIQQRNAKTAKTAALRFAYILFIFLIIRYTGHSQGPPQEAGERFGLGIKAMSEMMAAGRFDFIFYPLIMFGSAIIPDLLSPRFQVAAARSLLPLAVITFLGFSIILFFLTRHIEELKFKFFKAIIFISALWTFFSLFIYKANAATLSNSSLFLSLLTGGFTAILGIFLLIIFFRQRSFSAAIFTGLFWSILSFFFAWWWVPASIFPTTYRYLIVSAAGVAILLSAVIGLGKKRSSRIVLFLLLSPFLLINIWASRLYLNQSLTGHSQKISDKIWNSIPATPEITRSAEPYIFYFEGDGANGAALHDAITFGFPPHMALIYNLREGDPIPVPMSDFKEVASAVTDGKTMPAYGYKAKAVDIDRIYAFRLEGRDNLINITTLAREKLKQLIGN